MKLKHDDEIQSFLDFANEVENDTVLTRHGMLTHDNRYKHRTGDVVKYIELDNNLSNDQSYYFLYFMLTNNMNYEDAKKELLSSQEFEQYDARKKARQGLL